MKRTTEIWDEFSGQLLSFIKRRVSNQEDALDILQDVFIKIHTQVNRLEDEQKTKAWVYQISRNTIQDYYRASYRTSEQFNHSLDALVGEPEVNKAYRQVAFCCWSPFIDELPEKYQVVINLSMQGHKQAVIAQQLNTSVSNVKMRTQRAKEMLKEAFMNCCGYHKNTKGKLIGDQDCKRQCSGH